MHHLFLKKDLAALRERLDELEARRLETAKDAAVHVGQSSESWHDNAGHELAVREQMSMAKKTFEMRSLLSKAREVKPATTRSKVDVGLEITLKDVETGETKTFIISSYLVLKRISAKEVSYTAPLVHPFMEKRKGAKKKVVTPNGERVYQLVDIQRPDESLNGAD